MGTYIMKRLLALLPVIVIMSVVVFLIIYLIPGDPARVMLGDGADEETIRQLRGQMGLDLPLVEQYLRWVGGALRGDLGNSFFLKQPVSEAIAEHLQPTVSLALLAELVALAIAVPFGIRAAVRRGQFADKALTAYSLLGITIPGFLLSLFLVLLFAVRLRWLPVSGYAPLSDGLWNFLQYLILPAVSIGVVISAVIARIVRSSVLEVLNEPYVRTARSKGVSERALVYKHVLRNALIPILTVVGGTFGTLMAGAAVVETIFNIPGIGQMLVHSVERRDYAVIQGLVLFIAFVYVAVNLIVDLLYAAVDPRIRLGK
ncbi:ABC transporter permease [Paenibacillus hemerocallicola]|uniref:ABC transporter permease n=1 Tax=Paenibacillus hemerocallicola TaxID=1172614 RepID=A0A5C4T1F7_9BACL|nr:ABC transporter permease [Paenibacillus hemerocallicola]TNJ61979.1 ABC transporter permease [Paenibacillus hemerocallicola]